MLGEVAHRGMALLCRGAAGAASRAAATICRPEIIPQATPGASAAAAQLLSQDTRRWFNSSVAARHGGAAAAEGAETINVTFVTNQGEEETVKVPLGESLLEAAHSNDIELEGACEGSLACSTCHVIVENQEYFDMLDEPDEDELDMLDLAFGLTETSRLGCQIIARKDLDGLKVKIPSATRNFAVDGFKPKPH